MTGSIISKSFKSATCRRTTLQKYASPRIYHKFKQYTSTVLVKASVSLTQDVRVWNETSFHGEWVKGVSAGGCGNPPHRGDYFTQTTENIFFSLQQIKCVADLYWTNPQFLVTPTEPDDSDGDDVTDGKCVLIVSLMQKDSRALRSVLKTDMANVAMAFDIYKVRCCEL